MGRRGVRKMQPRRPTKGFVPPRVSRGNEAENDLVVEDLVEVGHEAADDLDVDDGLETLFGVGHEDADVNEPVEDVAFPTAIVAADDPDFVVPMDEAVMDRTGDGVESVDEDSDDSSAEEFEGGEDSDLPSAGGSSEDDEEWALSRQKLRAGNVVEDKGIDAATERELADSDEEYFRHAISSDEEGNVREDIVKFKVESDANLKNFKWAVGMKFSSADIFKTQVCRYSAISGYCIKWVRSNNERMEAKCKTGCPWRIYAGWNGRKEYFLVKTVAGAHSCNRQDFENVQVTPSFLAKEYLVKY